MGFALRASTLLLTAAVAAVTAVSEGDELLEKTRARVLDSARRLPRYTCVETVARAQYLPPLGSGFTCPAVMARHRRDDSQGGLVMRDRLRLDVAVINGEEMFSWAGARRFETRDIDRLVGGGASGSGDFGSFLLSVFGTAPEAIHYRGLSDNFALFDYVVPVTRSNYRYRSDLAGVSRKTGYRGTFSVDPADADVRQLVVETDEFEPGDKACSVRHVMDYQRVELGNGDFLLPEVSTMNALYRDGGESVNTTHYSSCREYVGESTIRFDDSPSAAAGKSHAAKQGPKPLPPNTLVKINLDRPLDTDTTAAGDEVTAIAAFGHETARIHGRILRLAQFMIPSPRWILVMNFDSIERGGVLQPLSLAPIDGNQPSPFGALPKDAGVFTFGGRSDLVLDHKFHSVWETR
jgi:hypothetical protein